MSLAEAFLHEAGSAAAGLPVEAVEPVLAAHVTAARSAWPALALAPEDFVRHVAGRLGAAVTLDVLRAVHATDLYLACACGRGDEAALRAFETRFLAPAVAQLRARGAAAGLRDDTMQALRTRLLVGGEGTAPRIATYSGRAPLLDWLRTVAARVQIDELAEQNSDARLSDADLGDLRAPGPDPEIDYLKRLYRAELGEAFADTLAGLPPREGNFVRLHYLEGMTMEAIAALFRVSRRTVHRSITQSRRDMFEKTKRLLGERLKISPTEFDTIMGLARSQLDLNLQELLAAESDE